MKVLKTLVVGMLLTLVITFSMKNAGNVRLKYFNVMDPLEIPLFLLILVSIAFGMFIGAMADLMIRRRLKKAIRGEQRAMDELQKAVGSLRGLPLFGGKEEEG
jgi:uncharacterized integral membrane protein